MITNLLWRLVAFVVSRPTVTFWLINRAMRTPYKHIPPSGPDEGSYMGRYWLFNPYGKADEERWMPARWPWLPSVKIHHIKRADRERDMHNHPWPKARTIILRGWYTEHRAHRHFVRSSGDTVPIGSDVFHSIGQVSIGGVWTLFITWEPSGWGFKVGDTLVPAREYLKKDAL